MSVHVYTSENVASNVRYYLQKWRFTALDGTVDTGNVSKVLYLALTTPCLWLRYNNQSCNASNLYSAQHGN